ncbi:hypothetical protein ACFUPZ_18515 [Microbacterium oxydans]|uniref:hypothetical protein n=1 Tax=Microbacterium oxydans TaxID=82380 RepID=UPI00363F9730
MKKAWSFFWLVVASIMAITILVSLIEPYLWIIITLFVLGVLSFVGTKVYRYIVEARRHY